MFTASARRVQAQGFHDAVRDKAPLNAVSANAASRATGRGIHQAVARPFHIAAAARSSFSLLDQLSEMPWMPQAA
jgi:hypothetical protein